MTTVTKTGKRFKVTDEKKVADKPITDKHKGKAFDSLPQKDKEELLKAVLRRLGMLDVNDLIQ